VAATPVHTDVADASDNNAHGAPRRFAEADGDVTSRCRRINAPPSTVEPEPRGRLIVTPDRHRGYRQLFNNAC
jgi:hypothetical protein